MRNAKWRTPPPVRPRSDNEWDADRQNVAGVGELKAVAERILEAGAHYLQQGRDWLETATTTRSEADMGTRARWGRTGDDDGWRDGRGRYEEGAGERERAGPRHAGNAYGAVYAPDEYSLRETGGCGATRAGYDYDDRRARAFDRRAAELARDRGRYRAGSGDSASSYRAGDDLSGWERAYEAQGYGSQRGRGPRGYTRSDERILEDVSERLTEDPVVDASDIDVRCESGRIVLQGQVPTRWMKHRAEDIADSIAGATEVDNRIRVAFGAQTSVDQGRGTGTSSGTQAGGSGDEIPATAVTPDAGVGQGDHRTSASSDRTSSEAADGKPH